MLAKKKIHIDVTTITIASYRSAILATVTALFCIASGLTYYSDARIAVTVGERYPSTLEYVAFWTGLVAQPWIFIALWIDSTFGTHDMHDILYGSISSTVTTSLVSACVLFLTLRLLFRSWSGWLFPVVACLCILAGISIYTFYVDIKVFDEANASYIGKP